MVQCLVPVQLARFVVVPVSQALNVFQRQDLHLLAAGLNLLAMAASFTAGWWLQLGPVPGRAHAQPRLEPGLARLLPVLLADRAKPGPGRADGPRCPGAVRGTLSTRP